MEEDEVEDSEACPICGTPMEDGDEGYCWTCEAHICPYCQHPFEIMGYSICEHCMLTEDMSGQLDEPGGSDNGLIRILGEPLSKNQQTFLKSLSEAEVLDKFGSSSVIGWSTDLRFFITDNISTYATTSQNDLGGHEVYFYPEGSDVAWDHLLPLLEKQKAGRDWLIENVS